MNIEKNHRPEKTDEELKRWLSSTGLSGDSSHIILTIPVIIRGKIGGMDMLKPLITYEQYIRTCVVYTPGEAERLIEISNQESIRELNQLISEYNADLPRIKAENDRQAVVDFYNKADELIRGDKAKKISLDD